MKFRGQFHDFNDTEFRHTWTHDFEAQSARAARRMAERWAADRDAVLYTNPEEVRGDSFDFPVVPRLHLVKG